MMDFEAGQRHREELAKKVVLDGDAVVLKVSGEYPIELSRCATPESLLGWIVHLCEKTWMTNDVMRRFILLATEENKIKIDRNL